jgi:integrase
MKAKVALVARVNDGTGSFPCTTVQIARRSIVLPVARGDGKVFNLADIIGFYARYPANGKRHIEPLGKDPVGAYTRFLQIEQDFSRVRAGLLPINEDKTPQPEVVNGDRNLRSCAGQFKANITTLGKKKSTITVYMRAVDAFVAQYPTRTIDDIDKNDMLGHLAFLRANIRKHSVGDTQHTLRNRLRNLRVFFNSFGVKIPLSMRDVKKPFKKRPTRHSIDDINLMLIKADVEEQDVIHFLVQTGFRYAEAKYAAWPDINFEQGSINVYPKPDYDWTPKNGKPRDQDIVLQPSLIKRMKDRKQRLGLGQSGLIFPGGDGRSKDLLKIVKRVAKRAGINERITLHAFRRTFGSIAAKEYGLEQARIWLGHSDIATTQAYIAADEMTNNQSRNKVTQMFSALLN